MMAHHDLGGLQQQLVTRHTIGGDLLALLRRRLVNLLFTFCKEHEGK